MVEEESERVERSKAWRDFRDFIDRLVSPKRLWRGVADAVNHRLIPSVGRIDPRGLPIVDIEKSLLNEFRRRVRLFAPVHTYSSWDIAALAQHHGLPTRLQDWTYNPLIAAFFAVTSSPLDQDGKIITILEPKEVKEPLSESKVSFFHDFLDIDDVYLVYPAAVSERIEAQRGVFTVHPNPTAAWVPPANLVLETFDIRKKYKDFFRKKLAELGVDDALVYADIDSLCKSISRGKML